MSVETACSLRATTEGLVEAIKGAARDLSRVTLGILREQLPKS
jgi:hypothetical protein